MTTNSIYPLTVGELQCTALLDALVDYHVADLFANVPAALVEPELARYGLALDGMLNCPYLSLLIEAGSRKVLVDTGYGDLWEPGGNLLACLHAAGVTPEQIDTVILTHGHGDHIGGNTGRDGRLQFPNAQWVMDKAEWAFWTAPANVHDAFTQGVVERKLLPLAGRVRLVEGETEIAPGVFTVPLPGHTPGHTLVAVRSQGQELLYASDAMLHPLQVEHPDWCASSYADMDCAAVVASRRALYARAASIHALLMAFHFNPFPGLGYIERAGQGWRWAPR